MKHEQAVALAQRCERWSIERPRLYDLSVAAFAFLGAVFPLSVFTGTIVALIVLAFVIHGIAALFFLKIVWVLGIPLFGVVRSLFRKPAAISGRRLMRDDAPELFTILDGLRGAYRTPRLDGVYLVADFRAAVSMSPRFGVFGGTQHNLILGLPALLALEMHHLEAVIAHEFGHMAQGRRAFDRFIYAIHATIAVTWNARVPQWLHPLLRIFFAWWYPRFDVSSLVVARRVEREADRRAAETSGAKIAAEALVAFTVQQLRLSRDFWPSLEREAITERIAPSDVLRRQMALLETPLDNGAPLLELALVRTTGPGDTHPVLRDRLIALGVEPAAAAAFLSTGEIGRTGSAAAAIFGSSLGGLLDSLGHDWASDAQENWSAVWGEQHARRKELQKLDAMATEAPLGDAQERERALLAGELFREDARSLLELQVASHPDDAALLLCLGRLLLVRHDDIHGIHYIGRAMRAEPETTDAAANMVLSYLLPRFGREEAARVISEIGANARVQGAAHALPPAFDA